MFGRIGLGELVLILLIALVIFGPKKLPEIGSAIGGAVREFKKQVNKLQGEIEADKPEKADAAGKPQDATKESRG
jgi:sec-independent protein translocase protein TatA